MLDAWLGDSNAAGAFCPARARMTTSARLANDRFSAAGRGTVEIRALEDLSFLQVICPKISPERKAVRQQTLRLGSTDSVYRGNTRCRFAGTSRGGSDGTRTRDLRRDRPVRGSRRLATIDAKPVPDVCCPVAAPARPLSWQTTQSSRQMDPERPGRANEWRRERPPPLGCVCSADLSAVGTHGARGNYHRSDLVKHAVETGEVAAGTGDRGGGMDGQ